MKKQRQIILTIVNTTQGIIPVSIMGSGNPDDVSNQITRYQWDLTGVVFTTPTLTIQVGPPNGALTTITVPLLGSNITAVIATLNSMNIGSFWQVGSSLVVETYNDGIVYGQLSVGTVAPTTTSLYWENDSLIAGGSLIIKVNTVIVVNSLNPGPASGTILNLVNGDQIEVDVQASPAEASDFNINQVLLVPPFGGGSLHSTTVPGSGSDTFSFTVNNNYSYQVLWATP